MPEAGLGQMSRRGLLGVAGVGLADSFRTACKDEAAELEML